MTTSLTMFLFLFVETVLQQSCLMIRFCTKCAMSCHAAGLSLIAATSLPFSTRSFFHENRGAAWERVTWTLERAGIVALVRQRRGSYFTPPPKKAPSLCNGDLARWPFVVCGLKGNPQSIVVVSLPPTIFCLN